MTKHYIANPALHTAEPNIPSMKPKRSTTKIEDRVKQKRLQEFLRRCERRWNERHGSDILAARSMKSTSA